MFLKDELKHVFEVSKKNIRFKNITNIAILQNCQFGKQMGMVAYFSKNVFLYSVKIYLNSMKKI